MAKLWDMHRHLVLLLTCLLCTCFVDLGVAQDPVVPATAGKPDKPQVQKAWLTEQLAQAIKDLESIDEKNVARQRLLQSVRDLCQEGLTLIERYSSLSPEKLQEPYSNPDLAPPKRIEISLPAALQGSLLFLDSQQLDERAAELLKYQRRIEQEIQNLDDRQGRLVAALAEKEHRLSEFQARTESRIRKEEETTEAELSEVNKRLQVTPKPEADLQRVLEARKRVTALKLRVLGRERRTRKQWISWLAASRSQIQAALKGLPAKLRKDYAQALSAVDEQQSQLKVLQLPAVFLPPTPGLQAEERKRIETVLTQQRGRIEDSIRNAVHARKLELRVHLELLAVQAEAKKTANLINDQIERTSSDQNESTTIRSFRLQMAIKALERELDRGILKGITWQEIRLESRRQAQQLEALQLQAEDVLDRARMDLGNALAKKALLEAPKLEAEMRAWSDREEKQIRAQLDTTELLLTDLLSLQGSLAHRRRALRSAVQVLESRGVLLQDPQRLILRGQGFGALFWEVGGVFGRLWTLPIDIYDTAIGGEAGGGGRAWGMYVTLFLILVAIGIAFWLRRKTTWMQKEILGSTEPERAQILRLSILAWFGRILPWVAIGLALHSSANLFFPGSQDARLCIASGKFFLYASFWIVTSRVLLRPAKPKLRFFLIQDKHAKRLYRIVNFGLVFWLLGLVGEMMGALLSGGQGRIFQAALLALASGGLLAMALLFFSRRRFLEDLFPAPGDGGLRFLQAFVMTVLWPIRIALAISLGAWLLTYYDLAHVLSVWILGGFGSLLIAVAFHQILRNEINDRFFLHRYRVDEDSLADLSDEERDLLISDRGKVAKLVASYLEILELLLSAVLFLGMVSWFYGLDWEGIQSLLDMRLWGSGDAQTRVTLGNLLTVILTVFLTLTLSRRSGPTVDYILEKRTEIDRGMRYTMGTLGGYVVFLLGVGVAASQLSIGFAQVSWILAALGVGIGFGLQDIVSNFFSGLILLFERPLRVGDVVRVGETLGEVKKITIRSTTVTSFDNIDVIVPNKDFISASITNWTASDRNMRSTIDVGVAYGSDLKRVRQVLVETVCKHGRVFKKPAPSVFVKSFGDSSIDFAVVYWTLLDYKRGTFSDLHFAIEAAFGREGIEIPFPQRDVNFKVDEIPVVLRRSEPDPQDVQAADPSSLEEDPVVRSKGKRDDDREIRRMSSKTQASEEIEAGGDGDGGDADL